MDQLSLNVDIYAITFLSFAELDTKTQRVTKQLRNCKLKKTFTKRRIHIPNNEVLADKNFSNALIIFIL